MNRKILVILDLDETLIYSTLSPADEQWDFQVFDYKVYKRPYLNEFLAFLHQHFRVAVWSSASDDYVEEIVRDIFPEDYPLEFVWGRSRCTYRMSLEDIEAAGHYDPFSHYHYVKRLSKVKKKRGEGLERVLIIDDTPSKSMHNYGNAIYPQEFIGNPDDDELLHLMQYLDTLKDTADVRRIEKRGWRD